MINQKLFTRFLFLIDPQRPLEVHGVLLYVNVLKTYYPNVELNIAVIASDTSNFAGVWTGDLEYITAICQSISKQVATSKPASDAAQAPPGDISALMTRLFWRNLVEGDSLVGADSLSIIIAYNGLLAETGFESTYEAVRAFFVSKPFPPFYQVKLLSFHLESQKAHVTFERISPNLNFVIDSVEITADAPYLATHQIERQFALKPIFINCASMAGPSFRILCSKVHCSIFGISSGAMECVRAFQPTDSFTLKHVGNATAKVHFLYNGLMMAANAEERFLCRCASNPNVFYMLEAAAGKSIGKLKMFEVFVKSIPEQCEKYFLSPQPNLFSPIAKALLTIMLPFTITIPFFNNISALLDHMFDVSQRKDSSWFPVGATNLEALHKELWGELYTLVGALAHHSEQHALVFEKVRKLKKQLESFYEFGSLADPKNSADLKNNQSTVNSQNRTDRMYKPYQTVSKVAAFETRPTTHLTQPDLAMLAPFSPQHDSEVPAIKIPDGRKDGFRPFNWRPPFDDSRKTWEGRPGAGASLVEF